jgi:methyl-accepting chemotaxis protein
LRCSVNEISRQVQEASRIAGQAVGQAHQTDARINDLSQAAARIGDVVEAEVGKFLATVGAA